MAQAPLSIPVALCVFLSRQNDFYSEQYVSHHFMTPSWIVAEHSTLSGDLGFANYCTVIVPALSTVFGIERWPPVKVRLASHNALPQFSVRAAVHIRKQVHVSNSKKMLSIR